jgi:membrane protein
MVRAFLRSAWHFVRTLYGRFWEHDLFLMAAAIAYYGFCAVIPLLLLEASVVASVMGSVPVKDEQLERALSHVFAGDVAEALCSELTGIVTRRGRVGGVGLLCLVWIGMRIFDVIERVLNRVWHVTDQRPWWRRKVMSLGVLLLAGVCFVFWLTLLSIAQVRGAGLAIWGVRPSDQPWMWWAFSVATLSVALIAMFLVIYKYLPYTRVQLRDAAVGAVFATVLWEAGRSVFFWSVASFQTYSRLYGTLAAIFAALVWIYFSSLILLLGAEVSRVCQEFRPEPIPTP